MIVSAPVAIGDLQSSRLRRILLRRRATVGLLLAAGLAWGIASYLATPPRYSAEAVLTLYARQLQGMPSEAVISPLSQDGPRMQTELDIIQSRLIAEKVLDRITVAGVTLDPYRRRGSLAEAAKAFVQTAMANIILAKPAAAAPLPSPETRRQDTIDMLLGNLHAVNDGRSLTIFVNYIADDPKVAAAVANAFAQAYIDHQTDVQLSAVETVRNWLGAKVAGLRLEVETAENARTEFLQQAGIMEVDGSTLQARRVASLDQELVNTRASLGGAQARLTTAQSLTTNDDGIAFSEVLASPTIQAFRIEQARLQRSIQDITNAGATKSGDLPALTSQLASINLQIETETKHVIDSLANEVAVLQSKERSLGGDLQTAQADLAQSNIALVKAAELDREASASRAIYDSYLTRYKQTVEQDGITAPEAQLISEAQIGSGKIGQSLPFALLLGIGFGGFAGLGAAFLREATDKRIRSPQQIEEASGGLEILGNIQSPKKPSGRHPNAPTRFERSIATLHASLRSNTSAIGAQVLTVTSSLQGEGKTLITAALARSLAASGCSVLVLDLDLDDKSLEETLYGVRTLALDQALRNPEFVLPAHASSEVGEITLIGCHVGRLPPEILLDAKRFGAMLQKARERFDMVLIDTPAMRKYGVASQAAAQSDMTLLVVNTARTSIRDVASAAEQLRNTSHGAVAVVTTNFTKAAPFSLGGDTDERKPSASLSSVTAASKNRSSGALSA